MSANTDPAASPAQPAPTAAQPSADFYDPRAQAVYAILADDTAPPPGEHWEGFAARRIVDALFPTAARGVQNIELPPPDSLSWPARTPRYDADTVRRLIAQAIADEREACARECDTVYRNARPESYDAEECAEAVRARGSVAQALASQPPAGAERASDEYGATDHGWTFAGIELEEGDKRLMTVLTKALGSDHPAIKDLVALLFRSRAAATLPPAGQPDEGARETDARRYGWLIETCGDERHGKPSLWASWDDDIDDYRSAAFFGLRTKEDFDAAIDAAIAQQSATDSDKGGEHAK